MRTDNLKPLEILLVEDCLDDAHLAYAALRGSRLAHRLTWLRDGLEARDFLFRGGRFVRAPRPDLLLLDLGLPRLDGRELLAEVRGDFELKDLPVIVMTASHAHEDVIRSELLHVDGYLTKPLCWDGMLHLLRTLPHCWRDELLLSEID